MRFSNIQNVLIIVLQILKIISGEEVKKWLLTAGAEPSLTT